MNTIREVCVPEKKAAICNHILRALPSWFGVEASIVEYATQVHHMPFFAAWNGEEAVGFVAIKEHNAHTAEVCVMGILEAYHRQGIGRQLISQCEEHCAATGRAFLTVKTLDASAKSKSYEKTRLFYLAMGFRPLEVFPLH